MLDVAEPLPAERDQADRFDRAFHEHYPELFRLTYRLLADRQAAEDVLQEAFLRLSGHPVLARPDEEVGAWLRRVSLNLGLNHLRATRRDRSRLERAARMAPAASDEQEESPSAAVLREEERAAVQRALQTLPNRQRECLLLRYAGYSYAEVAEALDVAVGSVGVLLARGERAFRHSFEEVLSQP